MAGRLFVSLVAAALVLTACDEKDSSLPSAPDFTTGAACNFNKLSDRTRDEFGGGSTEAGYVTAMKQAGSGTEVATFNGYRLLRSVANKFEGQTSTNSLSTGNAAALVVALLPCINTGNIGTPDSATIDATLKFTGAFAVRALSLTLPATSEFAPVKSHDDAWLLEPPGHPDGTDWVYDQSWQQVVSTGLNFADDRLDDAILVLGRANTDPNFTGDTPLSQVFDWSTIPAATLSGIVVGECVGPSSYLQHFSKSQVNLVEVLGFVKPSCFSGELNVAMERAPRNFAERVFQLLSPAPAYAGLLRSTGTGTKPSTLSPFQNIGTPVAKLTTIQWKKSGYVVNTPLDKTQAQVYQVLTNAGTKFKQQYILGWLEAANNSGSKVLVCDNYAYSDASGVIRLPKAYLNKAGGYIITTNFTGAFSLTIPSSPNDITVEVPNVPPAAPLVSTGINVKNDASKSPPDNCPTFVPQFVNGRLTNPPAFPGPNGN